MLRSPYQGSPTPFVAFLSTAPKVAGAPRDLVMTLGRNHNDGFLTTYSGAIRGRTP